MTDDLTSVMEALAGDICWCQRQGTGSNTSRDVMEALAGVQICEVCNNGVSETGYWHSEVANGSMHHCTKCHVDTVALLRDGHRCQVSLLGEISARCKTCGAVVTSSLRAPLWRQHVCQHTCTGVTLET